MGVDNIIYSPLKKPYGFPSQIERGFYLQKYLYII